MEVPGNWPMKIHLAREQGGGLSAFWRCTNGPIATGDNSEGPYWIDTDGADRFYAFAWHRTPGGGWYLSDPMAEANGYKRWAHRDAGGYGSIANLECEL